MYASALNIAGISIPAPDFSHVLIENRDLALLVHLVDCEIGCANPANGSIVFMSVEQVDGSCSERTEVVYLLMDFVRTRGLGGGGSRAHQYKHRGRWAVRHKTIKRPTIGIGGRPRL
jgi:hypothetical protein